MKALSERPHAWVNFMMRYDLGLEKPEPKRALKSALTIAGAYVVGGFIPLSPYMFSGNARTALWVSVILTLAVLLVFGYVTARISIVKEAGQRSNANVRRAVPMKRQRRTR